MKKIAIAYRKDTDDIFSISVIETIKKLGYDPYFLPQVKTCFLKYNNDKLLDCYKTSEYMLKEEYAEQVKTCSFDETNVSEVMDGISAVVFTGGEDISPTLFNVSKKAENNNEGFNAERDISDYILMKYCLKNDVMVFAICRGMQMMGVLYGCEVIQDLNNYYEKKSIQYEFVHRDKNRKEYTRHDIDINVNSLLYKIIQTDRIKDIPSWHHQAIIKVGKGVTESAVEITQGERIVESIEIKDKTFALGVQFHMEEILFNMNKKIYDEKDIAIAKNFFTKVLNCLTE